MQAKDLKVGLEVAVGPGVPHRARITGRYGFFTDVRFLSDGDPATQLGVERVSNRRIRHTWERELDLREEAYVQKGRDSLMSSAKAVGDVLWDDLVTKYPWLAGTRVGSPDAPVPVIVQAEANGDLRPTIRLDLPRLAEALAEIAKS